MKIPLKKGEYVAVHFLDHVEDGNRLMSCVVAGKIIKKGPKYITVAAWWVAGRPEVQKLNNKVFTIAVSTIEGWAPLGRWNGTHPTAQ